MWPQSWYVLIRPPCQNLPASLQTPEILLGGSPQESNEEAKGDGPPVVCPNARDYSHGP